MNRMMEAKYKNSGEYVYTTRVFSTMCNNCRLRGKLECRHKIEMPWSSAAQSAKIAALMADHQADYRREILNEDVESNISHAFPRNIINDLDNTSYVLTATHRIKHVFIGIDPAAGGSKSRFAIVSLAIIERDLGSTAASEHAYDVVVPPPLPYPSKHNQSNR